MQVKCVGSNHAKKMSSWFLKPILAFLHNYVHMWKITTNAWIILSWTIQIFLFEYVSCNVICKK